MCSASEIVAGIEARRQPALRDRPVEVVHHVLFARPDQLDRHARHLLGDRHRLAHVVLGAAAPAEAAAGVHLVDLALPERQPGRLGGGGERALAVLRRRPHLAALGRVLGRAVHRLHAGVVEERRRIDGLDPLGRAFDGGQRIAAAVGADVHLLGGQAFLQVLGDGGARDLAVGAVLVGDGQRLDGLLGLPPGVRHHRHRCRVDLDDMAHARHALRPWRHRS